MSAPAHATRRDFIKQTAGAALAATLTQSLIPPSLIAAEPTRLPPIVDTHTHFYDPTRPQGVPWPGRDDRELYRPVLPAEYIALTKPLGVVGTIVVEASPWLEDNQWVLDLCDREPFLLGMVGHLTPGTDRFAEHLQRFAAHRRFLGIRIPSATLPEQLPNPAFLRDIERFADRNLVLDINGGPTGLPAVAKLAQKFPDLRIVVNHLGNLPIDGKVPPASWHDAMHAIAMQPRTFVKVSALVESARQTTKEIPTDVAYYRPILDAITTCFGDERLLYGSNWPVSAPAQPYAVVQRLIADYFATKSPTTLANVFANNAQRCYRWPDPA